MNIPEFRLGLRAVRHAGQLSSLRISPPVASASDALESITAGREVSISGSAAYVFLHLVYWKYFMRDGHIDRFGDWPETAWAAIMETPSLLHETRRPNPSAPYRIKFISLMGGPAGRPTSVAEELGETDDWFVCGAVPDVRSFAMRAPAVARTGRKHVAVHEDDKRALHAVFFRISAK